MRRPAKIALAIPLTLLAIAVTAVEIAVVIDVVYPEVKLHVRAIQAEPYVRPEPDAAVVKTLPAPGAYTVDGVSYQMFDHGRVPDQTAQAPGVMKGSATFTADGCGQDLVVEAGRLDPGAYMERMEYKSEPGQPGSTRKSALRRGEPGAEEMYPWSNNGIGNILWSMSPLWDHEWDGDPTLYGICALTVMPRFTKVVSTEPLPDGGTRTTLAFDLPRWMEYSGWAHLNAIVPVSDPDPDVEITPGEAETMRTAMLVLQRYGVQDGAIMFEPTWPTGDGRNAMMSVAGDWSDIRYTVDTTPDGTWTLTEYSTMGELASRVALTPKR